MMFLSQAQESLGGLNKKMKRVYRSEFDVLMDVLVVFYEYNNLNVSKLYHKANLCTAVRREVIDKLVVSGFVGVNNNSFLFLTSKGERLVSEVVPKYKKCQEFYHNLVKDYSEGRL